MRIARHNPLPRTEIAKKGKVYNLPLFRSLQTAVRTKILTWFLAPPSFPAPEPRPSWAHLVSVHPREEQPVRLALWALAQAVVEAELVLLSYRIRQLLE
jgi:hypothetical protein